MSRTPPTSHSVRAYHTTTCQRLNQAKVRAMVSVRAQGPIDLLHFRQLRIVPATGLACEGTLRDVLVRTGLDPSTSITRLCTERVFLNYTLSLINDQKWKSAGAIHTRIKMVRALMSREGQLTPTNRMKEIIQTLKRLETLDPVDQAYPLKGREMGLILKQCEEEGHTQLLALLAITWLLAMRLGTALLITTDGLTLEGVQKHVQCHRFKNLGTAHGQYPLMDTNPLLQHVKTWQRIRQGHHLLFTLSNSTVLRTLSRMAKRKLGGHSFRRGVLQELQRRGVSTPDLLAM